MARRRSEQDFESLGTDLVAFSNDLAVSQVIDGPNPSVGDLQYLISEALAPVQYRKRTLREWWKGEHAATNDVDAKNYYSHLVRIAITGRCQLIDSFMALADKEAEYRDKQTQAKLKVLKTRTDALELEAKRIALEDEICERLALRESRLETRQLEETAKQHQVRVALKPARRPSERTLAGKAAARERLKLKATVQAGQETISDFSQELHRLWKLDIDDSEKAMRLKALLGVFDAEAADLPSHIQRFLVATEERANA